MFCSDKQLYVTLVDDQNKKNLFYGSTLQKSVREDPTSSTVVSTQIKTFLEKKERISLCKSYFKEETLTTFQVNKLFGIVGASYSLI